MDSVQVRPARPEDAGQLLHIYADYVKNTAISFEYTVPSLSEFRERIEHTLRCYPYLVLEREGEILGYAYAGPFANRAAYQWSCEMSIYLASNARRCGYGRLLYEELERQLKQQGMENLYACIACTEQEDERLTNDSVRFHEHMGFVRAGLFRQCGYKFNRWYDMVWMEKLVGDHKNKPDVWG